MRCMIRDPQGRKCEESENCARCGFEEKEIERRRGVPLTDAVVSVPFTDWDTMKTEYKDFKVRRKVIPVQD